MTGFRLTTEQEGLRILPLATDPEGAKVLVPSALWSFRLRLTPELELIEVLGADLSFAQPFEQVLAQTGGRSSHRILSARATGLGDDPRAH